MTSFNLGKAPEGDKADNLWQGLENGHAMLIGTSGAGKSRLIEHLSAQAAAAGQTFQYVEIKPTEEDRRAQVEREKMEQEKRALRLKAVRDAYWDDTDPDSAEWACLHDSLTEIGIADSTVSQCRILFDLLPRNIIGQGISWRFSDTSVGDDIFEFARENRDLIHAAIAAQTGK